MSALASLAAAIRDRTLLAWCVEHAPDGDADAALHRAVEAAGVSDLIALVDTRWPEARGTLGTLNSALCRSLYDNDWGHDCPYNRRLRAAILEMAPRFADLAREP